MPTLSTRSLAAGLCMLAAAVTSFAACDAGDDTVYPNPLDAQGDGGRAAAGAGGKAGGGNGGAAGGSAGQAGASGNAGSAGAAGASGAGGSAGASGTAGTSGSSGSGGSAGFGGSTTLGGSGGAAGNAGTAGQNGGGASGGAGASGKAGSGGGNTSNAYDQACDALAASLTTCGASQATIDAVKTSCAPSRACAEKLYIDGAPQKVLACLGASCTVPAVLPSANSNGSCLENIGTDESEALRNQYKQKLNTLVSMCGPDDDKAAATLKSMGDVHGFYRAAFYTQLSNCLESASKTCTTAISCLKSQLQSACGAADDPASKTGWIWPTDAVITNAVAP